MSEDAHPYPHYNLDEDNDPYSDEDSNCWTLPEAIPVERAHTLLSSSLTLTGAEVEVLEKAIDGDPHSPSTWIRLSIIIQNHIDEIPMDF